MCIYTCVLPPLQMERVTMKKWTVQTAHASVAPSHVHQYPSVQILLVATLELIPAVQVAQAVPMATRLLCKTPMYTYV